MSSASPFRRSAPDVPVSGAQWLESLAVSTAQFAGFWSAVVLPFALLGMIASGLTAGQAPLFAALLACNLVALRAGRGYNRN